MSLAVLWLIWPFRILKKSPMGPDLSIEKVGVGDRRFLKTWVKKGQISWWKIEPILSLIDANATTQRVNSFEMIEIK